MPIHKNNYVHLGLRKPARAMFLEKKPLKGNLGFQLSLFLTYRHEFEAITHFISFCSLDDVAALPSVVHQTAEVDVFSNTFLKGTISKIINPTTLPQPAGIVKVVPPACL